MGVERFVSRRGTPAMIWSGNGTNFIGAEKELRECMEKWNTLNIAAELARKGIKWRFNPPSAPHQGGIWERLVLSFKRVLYTIPVRVASQMKCWTLLFVWSNTH